MTQPTDDIDKTCEAPDEINISDADKNTENDDQDDDEEHNKVDRDVVDANAMLLSDYINLLEVICMYFN